MQVKYDELKRDVEGIDFEELTDHEWFSSFEPSRVCLVAKLSGYNIVADDSMVGKEDIRECEIQSKVRSKYGGSPDFWRRMIAAFDNARGNCRVGEYAKTKMLLWIEQRQEASV